MPPKRHVYFHKKKTFSAGVGAGLMIGKTMIIVLGMQLISYASRIEDGSRRCRIKILGIAMAMAIRPFAEITACAFAPQSLLTPLNGFDLVWNALLAPLTLGEKYKCGRLVGTLVVFVGSSLAPMAGPHAVTAMSLEKLRRIFLSERLLVYAAASLLCFLAGLAVLRRRTQLSRGHLLGKDVVRGTLIGMGGGSARAELLPLGVCHPRARLY